MTDYGGDVVCLWDGNNTTGPMWTPSSNEYDVFPVTTDGMVGMNCNVMSNVAPNHTNNSCNYMTSDPSAFEFTGYDGQSDYAVDMDQMYGNMEVFGIHPPQHFPPRSSTPTQVHMWPCFTDDSNTGANEHVSYPPVGDTDTIIEQMSTEPKHLIVKALKPPKTKVKSAAALARQSLKEKKAEKKEAKLLLGLATVGIVKTSKQVSTPRGTNTNRAVSNATSAKKYRSAKYDRMAFLVQANERIEFENMMLRMQIDTYNINGVVHK
jgi:hypothetical protein